LEGLPAPYYAAQDAAPQIVLASPRAAAAAGPKSDEADARRRTTLKKDDLRRSSWRPSAVGGMVVGNLFQCDFSIPAGHGPFVDLTHDKPFIG